jgi:hypothetical protein
MVHKIIFRVNPDGFYPVRVQKNGCPSRLCHRAEAAVFCLIGRGHVKPPEVAEAFLTHDNPHVLVVVGKSRYLVRVP